MSAELYIGCQDCKQAFHIGYLVTVRSNFVFNRDLAERLHLLESFINIHCYCSPDGVYREPKIITEGSFDEDEWTIYDSDGASKPPGAPKDLSSV